MFYSLLGRVVWYLIKGYLRYRYGPTYVPKSVLAAGTVGTAFAVTFAVLRARSGDS